jgi:hypothetical protein
VPNEIPEATDVPKEIAEPVDLPNETTEATDLPNLPSFSASAINCTPNILRFFFRRGGQNYQSILCPVWLCGRQLRAEHLVRPHCTWLT